MYNTLGRCLIVCHATFYTIAMYIIKSTSLGMQSNWNVFPWNSYIYLLYPTVLHEPSTKWVKTQWHKKASTCNTNLIGVCFSANYPIVVIGTTMINIYLRNSLRASSMLPFFNVIIIDHHRGPCLAYGLFTIKRKIMKNITKHVLV